MALRSVLLAFLGATLSTGAWAADLPMRTAAAPPVPMIAPWSWTGLYVGGYAGGSFGSTKWTNINTPQQLSGNTSPSGFTGGGLVGYNYQIGAFVVGAEGEFGYDGRRGSNTFIATNGTLREAKFTGNDIGRIRARAGYAWGNMLIYAAGGVSFADGSLRLTNPANGFNQSVGNNFTGWNIGLGGEYAFTQNWIARLEYIYDGFGSHSYNYGFLANNNNFATRNLTWNENTVRVAVEYKFW
jgi:outer membrane immunogenic protein